MDARLLSDEYVTEAKFASENGIHQRTAARYRNEPDGLPFVEFGGKLHSSAACSRVA